MSRDFCCDSTQKMLNVYRENIILQVKSGRSSGIQTHDLTHPKGAR